MMCVVADFHIVGSNDQVEGLARFPIRRNRLIEKKSRQINKLERILAGQVCNLVGIRSKVPSIRDLML